MKTLSPFQKSAVDFDKHTALTANAGSGKTFVLAKRYVETALRNDIPLSKIAAITFTDKAAGELYKKITNEIERRIALGNSDSELSRLKRLRRQIVSANISTIHAFCISLLKEFAPYADLDINFAPINAKISGDLLQLSFEEVSSRMFEENDGSFKNLIRFFGSKNKLSAEIMKLFFKRKTMSKLSAYYLTNDVPDIAADWERLFENKFKQYFPGILDDIIVLAEKINEAVIAENPENKTAENIQDILNKFDENVKKNLFNYLSFVLQLKEQIAIKSGTVKKQGYLSKKLQSFLSEETALLNEAFGKILFLNSLDDFREVEINLAKKVKEIVYVFNEVNGEYAKKKKRNSYLDFEDLLLLARTALSKSEVIDQLAGKYDFIMVDEYQDTNEIQYEIILPLIQEFRRGNLFIVGDEKQSIYMFREADLQIFGKTKKQIAEETESKGEMNLPHSFRLDPNLALFINYLFRRLFANAREEFSETKANDLICAKDFTSEGRIGLLINNSENSAEADLVARKISALNKNGRNFCDIAILCRKRTYFEELSQCLENHSIPYSIIGSKGFYQNQIIIDFQNYLSFVINQNYDAALLSLLRSPFFYLPDTKIFEIKLTAGNNFFEKLKNYSGATGKFNSVVKLLQRHIKLAGGISIPDLLNDIIERTSILSVIKKRKTADRDFATIDKFLDLAVKYQSEPFNTLFDFVESVKAAVEKDTDESQAELFAGNDKVKIMTIHQSKGLEFPVVFLFRTNEKYKIDINKSKELLVDREYGIITKAPRIENHFAEMESAPHTALFNYYYRQKQVAEEKRLLYVALTRAEEEIYISADTRRKKSDSFWSEISGAIGYKPEYTSIKLVGNLTFMDSKKNFELSERELSFEITVETEIPYEIKEEDEQKEKEITGRYLLDIIEDKAKNEIYSATKIAVFNQCPLKYDLIYNKGLSKLQTRLKIERTFEFNPSEDAIEENIPANVFGSLVHKILEEEIPEESIDETISKFIVEALYDENKLIDFKKEVKSVVGKFYSSDKYAELKKRVKYKNEFEIYSRRKDFFLYGIIDKLIIENNKAIIVDYKTDKLGALTPAEKLVHYELQLLFYAFLISRHFDSLKEIELALVFVREPEKSISRKCLPEELKNFEFKIEAIISNISGNNFRKNLNHCVSCQFSTNNGKCIIND